MKAAADIPETLRDYQHWALNPWTVLAAVVAGAGFGAAAPGAGAALAVVGVAYVDLLKMVVLPFMLSAVIFSLQSLYREGGAVRMFRRVALVLAAASLAAALLATFTGMLVQPGRGMADDTRAALGKLVSADIQGGNTSMALRAEPAPPRVASVKEVLESLIPQNIFAVLANGETLKALVFALLFGFAVGQVPTRIASGLQDALETVYHACQTLTRWVNLPVPLVLFCIAASQVALNGLGPFKVMGGFVAAFLFTCALLLALAMIVLARRSGADYPAVLRAMRAPFALGVATNNSATCMPAMIDALVRELEFARARAELLVPLTIALLRIGAVAYFICATQFIAALYGRPLGVADLAVLAGVSVLAGFASAGMAGIVTVSVVGTIAAHLALPFEAAFVLLAAVDPLCAMARTAVTVVGGCAAVAAICPQPVRL